MSFIRSALLSSHGFSHGFGTRKTALDELPRELYTLRQVHGDRIISLGKTMPEKSECFVEGDALVATLAGIFIGIRTADCLPVLIADTSTGAVAAVHCGWRGLAAGIAAKAVKTLLKVTGSDPEGLSAALGPAIDICCYEVGEDVRAAFMNIPGSSLSLERRGGSTYASLGNAASAQLVAEGIREKNIESTGHCTSCERDLFYSFRGEKTDKRMTSFIGSKSPASQ